MGLNDVIDCNIEARDVITSIEFFKRSIVNFVLKARGIPLTTLWFVYEFNFAVKTYIL